MYLETLLKLHIWTILGRLIFCVYLVHILSMMFATATLYNYYLPTTIIGMVTFWLVYVVTTFWFAFLLHVLVEAPFNSILSQATRQLVEKTAATGQENIGPKLDMNNNRVTELKSEKKTS